MVARKILSALHSIKGKIIFTSFNIFSHYIFLLIFSCRSKQNENMHFSLLHDVMYINLIHVLLGD